MPIIPIPQNSKNLSNNLTEEKLLEMSLQAIHSCAWGDTKPIFMKESCYINQWRVPFADLSSGLYKQIGIRAILVLAPGQKCQHAPLDSRKRIALLWIKQLERIRQDISDIRLVWVYGLGLNNRQAARQAIWESTKNWKVPYSRYFRGKPNFPFYLA